MAATNAGHGTLAAVIVAGHFASLGLAFAVIALAARVSNGSLDTGGLGDLTSLDQANLTYGMAGACPDGRFSRLTPRSRSPSPQECRWNCGACKLNGRWPTIPDLSVGIRRRTDHVWA
jgi:hypothetical protein